MTDPAAPTWPLGRRPHLNCHRTSDHGPQDIPPPGTIIELPGGLTVLYVGNEWTADQAETAALAERLRGASKIEIVGDMWNAARPCKHALHDAWNTANKAARDAAKPPKPIDLVKPSKARCARPRSDGEPCQRRAGFGTDTVGFGPCVDHGGSGERRQAAAKKLREQSLLVDVLTAKARIKPPTLREQLDGLIAAREVLIATEELQLYRRRR